MNEARHVEVAARPPGVVEYIGQQDMLAACDIGSALTPMSASSPETAEPTRSRYASVWPIRAGGGAANDRSTVSGNPALLPGV